MNNNLDLSIDFIDARSYAYFFLIRIREGVCATLGGYLYVCPSIGAGN
jgi:hypothetical protein